jgi:hypothetical protein
MLVPNAQNDRVERELFEWWRRQAGMVYCACRADMNNPPRVLPDRFQVKNVQPRECTGSPFVEVTAAVGGAEIRFTLDFHLGDTLAMVRPMTLGRKQPSTSEKQLEL